MIFPKSDVRNQIVSVLSEDFPLPFRKLSNKLKGDYDFIPDRTLARIIKILLKDNILMKENNEYLINAKWLENIDNFKQKVAKNYIESPIEHKDKSKFL